MDNKEANNIDLTFGPSWARPSADKWVFHETQQNVKRKSGRRPGNRQEGEARYGRRRENGQDSADPGNQANKSRFRHAKAYPASDERKHQADAPRHQRQHGGVFPQTTISFVPERRGLKPLVKQLAGTRRAYALFDVAATFLSRPEFYAAVIKSKRNDGQPVHPLYQCTQCKAVFLNKHLALTHGLNRHSDLFYEKEEKQGEAPQGNFPCVARCTLSGELLGPPNHHEFSEKLQEFHRARFAHMPMEEYRKKIVNETDPAIIAQWKKAAACKTIYRTKLLGEPIIFERGSHLEKHFVENYAASLIREAQKFVIPATASKNLDDRQISQSIQEAWQKESRFPINMAFAIQQRFRRLGLHIFKTSSKMTFVSAVKPHSIDPAQATEIIRLILEWINKNNGKTRQDLVSAVAPGSAPESERVAGIINSLVWLIDRGHVIEFTNGTLAIANHINLISYR